MTRTKKLILSYATAIGGILLTGVGFTIACGPFVNTFCFIFGMVAFIVGIYYFFKV